MRSNGRVGELTVELGRLGQFEDELLEIHREMLQYQALVNEFWISGETDGINDLIDRLLGQIRRSIDELYGIGHDMVKAYEDFAKGQGV